MSRASAVLALAMVLTVGTGAIDAISFLRLGGVFSSVITGNLVLLGLAAGRADATLAAHLGVAGAAFIAGVLAGAGLTGPTTADHPVWPARVNVALGAELVSLSLLLGWWAAVGSHPRGGVQFALLALAALAMGLQSAAVRAIGIAGLSTTYMTGTLTSALATVVSAGKVHWHSLALIGSVLAGAAASGLLIITAPSAAPALPLGLLAAALVTATIMLPRLETERGGSLHPEVQQG